MLNRKIILHASSKFHFIFTHEMILYSSILITNFLHTCVKEAFKYNIAKVNSCPWAANLCLIHPSTSYLFLFSLALLPPSLSLPSIPVFVIISKHKLILTDFFFFLLGPYFVMPMMELPAVYLASKH